MHPDKPDVIDELHAHFRQILIDGLSPAQLALHDYFSVHGPIPGDFEEEEFPLYEGLVELLGYDDDDEYELEEEDLDDEPAELSLLAAVPMGASLPGQPPLSEA